MCLKGGGQNCFFKKHNLAAVNIKGKRTFEPAGEMPNAGKTEPRRPLLPGKKKKQKKRLLNKVAKTRIGKHGNGGGIRPWRGWVQKLSWKERNEGGEKKGNQGPHAQQRAVRHPVE